MNKFLRLAVTSFVFLSTSILSISNALATPIVDGTKDLDYGAAVSVQTVQTQFGDNFSELNAAYATIDSGNLFLMLTGNIEENFNRLEIFIDSKAGGQTSFSSAGNDNSVVMAGLLLETAKRMGTKRLLLKNSAISRLG